DLRLNNNSSITATAGSTGDGGNININTDTLTALDNSSITANAFAGRGGNININAQGVFFSPDSILSASSELGIDGTVNINTPETNFQRELEQLQVTSVSTEEVIAQSCVTQQNARRGSFVDAGNGGLPSSPSTAISEFPTEENNISQVSQNNSSNSEQNDFSIPPDNRVWLSRVPSWKPGSSIIRGNKVITTQDGQRRLVADADAETVEGAEYLVCKEKSDR
ncbi:MAG: S-layer family protein, partial [Hydrococcus sp. RM1_1_31]|nr:S-layer family protein [Hydrococcus sp. RM1_1_31]